MFGKKKSYKNTLRVKLPENTVLATDESNNPNRYAMTFSPKMVIPLCIAAVFVLGWVFVLGVIVGRGYAPTLAVKPSAIPVIPESQKKEPQVPVAEEVILQPEELDFLNTLRTPVQEPSSPAESGLYAQLPSEKPSTAEKASPSLERRKATVRAKDTKTTRRQRTVAATREKKSGTTTTPNTASESVIRDYVYQIASYNGPITAENMRVHLASEGFNSYVVSEQTPDGVTRYRVRMAFRGNEAAAERLRKNLARIGIEKIFVVSKKPVTE